MRLGLVAPEFPPSVGGVQTCTLELAAEFARRGHAVTVFAPENAAVDRAWPFAVAPELKLRTAVDAARLRAAPVDAWLGMNATCAWLESLGKPATVFAHGSDFLNAYTPFARPRWRPPVGARLNHALERWLGLRQLRRHLPRVLQIFTNSACTAQRLGALHPRCRARTTVAGLGVAREFFAAPLAPRAGGPTRLVTAARLDEPRKNIAPLIAALGRLKDRFDFRLEIVGDGETRPALAALAARGGVGERVRFAGRVPAEQLMQLLSTADLFVLTPGEDAHSFEGFGLVYLEANACGAPVLAARTGGVPEAVADGQSGFFVAAPNEAEIARSLARFLAGEIRFDRAVCRAHAAAHTWARVADRIEPFLAR